MARRESGDHVDRRFVYILFPAAAQRLAVDGDHRPWSVGDRCDPVHEAALELRGIKDRKDSPR